MPGRVGAIPTEITLAASQSIRRNAADNGFEAYTPSTGSGDLGTQYTPSASQTVAAGRALYVPGGRYEIAAGTTLEIEATACMEIG